MKSYAWKDPKAITGVSVTCVSISLLIQLCSFGVWLIFQGGAAYEADQVNLTTGQGYRAAFDLGLGIAYLVCFPVLFWIARVCRNAHSFSKQMAITPGWAVGWYFVPIASLFKPYESMKEIWLTSSGLTEKDTPDILRQWWGCFIVSNLLASISNNGALSGNWIIGAASNGMGIVVSLIFINMMRQICDMQIAIKEIHSVFDDPRSIWDAQVGN